MTIPHNLLRTYRKRSRLSLADMAFLMNQSDYSGLSRCERGSRSSVAMLLTYHLLFETPVETFFERQKADMVSVLKERVTALIHNLKEVGSGEKTDARIAFLESVLNRFNRDGYGGEQA